MNTTRNTTLLQDLRALPGQYWILFSGTLINRFGHFVIPFLAIYLRGKGYEAATVGLVLSSYGAGAMLAGVIGGYLADHIGRKPTMLISCFGSGGFMLLLSQANNIPALVVSTAATGLLAAMYFPASSALIADLIPAHLRVRAFACQRLAVNAGFAAGMATAGFMAKNSFTTLFIVDAATTFILGAAVCFGLKSKVLPVGNKGGWMPALRHMKNNLAFQLAAGAALLIAVVFWQMSSSYGLQVTEGACLDERTYGLLMALNGIMIVFLELPLTSFTRRFNPQKIMAIGYAITGIGMGLNFFGATLSMLAINMVVFTFGEMISSPVASSYLAGLAPDEMRGRYQGVISIAWSSATMLGPSLGLGLYQFNPGFLWITITLFGLSAAAMILNSGRCRAAFPAAIPQSQP